MQILAEDPDRELMVQTIGETLMRCDGTALAYCLMDNTLHLVLATISGNMPGLMYQLNAAYALGFNERRGQEGQAFQARYIAALLERDACLEACRHVDLSPVRARVVSQPGDWPWSSYRSHCSTASYEDVPWLGTADLHAHLIGHDSVTPLDASQGAERYAQFVSKGARRRRPSAGA